MRVCFLVSGGGGTLRAIHYARELVGLPIDHLSVIADRSCAAAQFARQHAFDLTTVEYSRADPECLRTELRKMAPQLIVTNIHKIIDEMTLSTVEATFVNLHYSLLPSFAGLIGMRTLSAARERNCRIIGSTCHRVVAEVDTGTVLSQSGFACDWELDQISLLQNSVFRAGCMSLMDVILRFGNALARAPLHSHVELGTGKLATFSPSLSYDTSCLDETFWDRVARP